MRRKSISPIYESVLCGALLAVLVTGCNNEDFVSPSTGEKDAVIISAGAALSVDAGQATRAADDIWGAGDRIGITMLGTATGNAVNNYTNREYVAASAGTNVPFEPEQGTEQMYYPIDGSGVTFKACYPYTGLADYRDYPVDVSGQSDLAKLDLMTAGHKNSDNTAVNSKDKKEAHLVFHHRMTMVIVNLLTEPGSPIDLDGSRLVIKGMKTTGDYNLMSDVLAVDAGSVQDIAIPLSNAHSGRAILLPREAGAGVTFEVATQNGGVYTADMGADLELKKGSRYTFNLTLKTTPTLITASIGDWTDGPVRSYDAVHLHTPGLSGNEGFAQGQQLDLYVKDNGDPGYAKKGAFVYDHANGWEAVAPILWENLTGPEVGFKATSVHAPALNTSQMPDYLLGGTTGVALYNGVHIEMKHLGTKATVTVSSGDGSYSAADLEGAVVTLPQYLNNGSLDGGNGDYNIGAGRGDIAPEKQGTAVPKKRVAIFPHQTVAAGTTLVKVEINGHVYEVKDNADFTFEQGKHHLIRLDIRKSGVQITAKAVDWVDGKGYETEVRLGTPTLGTNENIPDGSELHLFAEETPAGGRSGVRGYFTYNLAGNSWRYSEPSQPLLWEELPNSGRFFASIERDAVSGAAGNNQSKDYIVADPPVENNGGAGNTALHFGMRHAVSQVKVVLRPSDTYTKDQLKEAVITLPGYAFGGSLHNGVYEPGVNTGDILLGKPDNDEVSSRSYLQAQAIPAGNTVARVEVGGRIYNVTYDHDVLYNAGEITHLYVTIKGLLLQVSVRVAGWQDQTPVELTYSFNHAGSSVEGFEKDDAIRIYHLTPVSAVTNSKTYVVGDDGANPVLNPQDGTPWYSNDFSNGDRIVAVFPAPDVVPEVAPGESSFEWNMAGKSDPANRLNDILVAHDGLITDRSANVDLTFNHVLGKVTVNIIAGEGFVPGEITGANTSVALVDFFQKGVVGITSGEVDGLNNGQSVATNGITANTGAALSYQALVLPQTKGPDPVLAKVTLNGIVYDAKWTGPFRFEAGKNHVLNVTLAKTGLKLSATIVDWEDGSSGSITID